MDNQFSAIFGKYLDISKIPKAINESKILNVKVDASERSMEISAQLNELVEREEIFAVEKQIATGVLGLSECLYLPQREQCAKLSCSREYPLYLLGEEASHALIELENDISREAVRHGNIKIALGKFSRFNVPAEIDRRFL